MFRQKWQELQKVKELENAKNNRKGCQYALNFQLFLSNLQKAQSSIKDNERYFCEL